MDDGLDACFSFLSHDYSLDGNENFAPLYDGIQQTQQLYDNLVHNIEKKNIRDLRLAVPSSESVFFFTLDEIPRLEADKKTAVFGQQNAETFR